MRIELGLLTFAALTATVAAAGNLPEAAEPREKYMMEFGVYELKPPLLKAPPPAAGFHGRFAELERIDADNAVGPERRTQRLFAWRGERVHAQAVVWTSAALDGLRLETGALTGTDGATIPATAVSGRFVKYMLAVPLKDRLKSARDYGDSVGDCLDDIERLAMPTNSFRPCWFTVAVPAAAKPGRYRGKVAAVADGGHRIEFELELEVNAHVLPRERQFFLDLWQNPWAVARYHGVKPFSKLHYELLRPLYAELAAAGQKVITTTIGDYPWNRDTYLDNYRSMVKHIKGADGSWKYDFSLWDEYVAFAESCGIGPQIHCYTMVKFGWRLPLERHYYYTDEATGDERSIFMTPDDPRFEEFWRPFLLAFERHVHERGLAGRVYIALDELPPPSAKNACDLIRKYAPSLKFALASDKPPQGFDDAGVEAENFSQALRIRQGVHLIDRPFLAKLPARRAAGRTTTYYICNIPEKPNTWVRSPLVESEWQGLYAAAQGFDGMLRWAAFHWPRDPMFDASYGHYEPGEAHLIYPGARASTRWEMLKDSIEDFEKIRILREEGAAGVGLEAALAEIDFLKMHDSSEAEYRDRVARVHRELELASRPKCELQRRIDAVAAAGGGVVTVPPGRLVVPGVRLHSNIELHLEKGAVLEGSTAVEDYEVIRLPYSEGDWRAVVMAEGATNVAVTGEGEIFGNGAEFPMPQEFPPGFEGMRPRGLFFGNCRNVRLEGFTLRDAACWGIVFKNCDGVIARRVKVDSHVNLNNDGFDIEAKNVLIEDCDVDSGDDAYCLKSNDPSFTVENVVVRRCVGRSFCNPFKLGTASHGTMRNVRFEDCRSEAPRRDDTDRARGSKGKVFINAERQRRHFALADRETGFANSGIAIECVDGGTVEDVVFRNLELNGVGVPIFVRGGTRTGRGIGTPPSDRHVLRRVLIERVRGRFSAATACSVSGVASCRPCDIVLRDIRLTRPGIGAAYDWRQPVPEAAGDYPEANMFGTPLPAYGLWTRAVDRLTVENFQCEVDPGTEDGREMIVQVGEER